MPLPLRWRYKLEKWRGSLRALFRTEPKPARPRLCPACGTLVGATATKCYECGASLTFSLAAASRSLSRLLPGTSPMTYAILGLSCLTYAVSLLLTLRFAAAEGAPGALGGLFSLGGISGAVLARLGASFPLLVDLNEPWRLITAIFLHGSLLHIAFNMWVLIDIGPQIEEVYGSARFLFLYVVTGVAGFLLSSFTAHVSVGASGALLGLIGVLLAITTRHSGAAMQMLRSQLIRWLVYIAVFGLLFPGIDNYAHFGGLATGFLLGRVMADRPPISVSERNRAYGLGWVAGIVVVASFAFMLMRYFRSV